MSNPIITLPHPTSQRHPRMPIPDRAAQFSPFAALSGYEDAIEETGRLTDFQPEPEEYLLEILDRKYRKLAEVQASHPQITITFFVPDKAKDGGAYASVSGKLKKLDVTGQRLTLEDGTDIPFCRIIGLDSDIIAEKHTDWGA